LSSHINLAERNNSTFCSKGIEAKTLLEERFKRGTTQQEEEEPFVRTKQRRSFRFSLLPPTCFRVVKVRRRIRPEEINAATATNNPRNKEPKSNGCKQGGAASNATAAAEEWRWLCFFARAPQSGRAKSGRAAEVEVSKTKRQKRQRPDVGK